MKHSHTTILAIEIRRHRMGFAVMEGPDRLLEWGVEKYTSPPSILRFVKPLISIFGPGVIAIRRARYKNQHHRRRANAVLRIIGVEASRSSTPIRIVTDNDLRHTIRQSGGNKDEIAATVARRFPELYWKLPPVRKPWISEGYNMAIFDAVATAMALWERDEKDSDEP